MPCSLLIQAMMSCGLLATAMPPFTEDMRAASSGSTLRTVTAMAGFALRSSMPKLVANLTSGGSSSVRTSRGKRDALVSARPASSRRLAGSSRRNSALEPNGGVNLTFCTKLALPSSFAIVALIMFLPSTRRIFLASFSLIGAEKFSDIGNTGVHCASLLARSQLNCAVKLGRTLKSLACG